MTVKVNTVECRDCGAPAGERCYPFRPVVVRFADDVSGRTFSGYTTGRLWNGFACPHLPLDEFRRVLDVLLEWGDEKHYTVLDDQRQVLVHGGMAGTADAYVNMMTAKIAATPDGDRWLFDCGGAWTFVEVSQGELS